MTTTNRDDFDLDETAAEGIRAWENDFSQVTVGVCLELWLNDDDEETTRTKTTLTKMRTTTIENGIATMKTIDEVEDAAESVVDCIDRTE